MQPFRLGEDDLHAWEQSGLPGDALWPTDRERPRVLVPEGRIAIYTTSLEAPRKPSSTRARASRSHLYDNEELGALACKAQLRSVIVADDNGGQLLTKGAVWPADPCR